MQIASLGTGMMSAAICCAAALALLAAPGVWAQEKQKVSFKVGAENAKYPQRHTLDVGDEAGHQLTLFEIHRSFPANAPVINGVRLKETWTRGYGDYVNSNGNSGYFQLQHLVYDRAEQPCRTCGSPIRQTRQGQRSTFYCPHCQN